MADNWMEKEISTGAFIENGFERPCAYCGLSTKYVDVVSFAFLCSEKCTHAYYVKMAEATADREDIKE